MSEANVALVRAILDSPAGQSKQEILAALDAVVPTLFTEDVEFVETPERVDARTFHGHEGVKEAFTRYLDQWEAYGVEVTKVEDHGSRVFAAVKEQARGRGSGARVEGDLYVVFDFRAEKVCRYREFLDESAAREALGG